MSERCVGLKHKFQINCWLGYAINIEINACTFNDNKMILSLDRIFMVRRDRVLCFVRILLGKKSNDSDN